MANNKRLFLSLSEEDVARLDVLRTELGMNRSQYIRYVLSGQKKKLVPSMQYKDAIGKLSSIDLSLRVIALNESLAEEDRLAIYSELDEIKKILCIQPHPDDNEIGMGGIISFYEYTYG